MFKIAVPMNIAEMAHLLQNRKREGKRSMLFLGARTGGFFGNQAFYNYLEKYSLRTFTGLSEVEKFQACHHILQERFKEDDTYEILKNSLEKVVDREEDNSMAALVKEELFDIIISTNIDSLLEDTFVLKGLRKPGDYLVPNGLINGKDAFARKAKYCTSIKVFGDLSVQIYKTPVSKFDPNTEKSLKELLGAIPIRDVVVVGYDEVWDRQVESVLLAGKELWYINEELPSYNSSIMQALEQRAGKYLVGLHYNRFVSELHNNFIQDTGIPIIKVGGEVKVNNARRRKVFISYSHRDAQYLARFQTHMVPYIGNEKDLLEAWDDTQINPGEKWSEKIEEALAATKVAVLLVSADFLASNYIMEKELPTLLEAEEAGEVAIIPVIINHCAYDNSPLSSYQTVNNPLLPVEGMSESDREKVWAKTAKRVFSVMYPKA